LGNYSEFKRATDFIIKNVNFDKDINVSVFEVNIRVVGGLLSAHLLSHKAGIELEKGWPCNGALLRLAEKVAKKLLPAFDTKTGMPYGTVNLKYGVPLDETTITCTAGIGTFIVEFGTLSRLTGDPIYEEVAMNALYSLYNHRSAIGNYDYSFKTLFLLFFNFLKVSWVITLIFKRESGRLWILELVRELTRILSI
jgi:mannosidase alpha-like ER degradation enhancer 2